jgi:hypothetical protein
MAGTGSIKGNKLELASGAAGVRMNGASLEIFDATSGAKTMAQLLANVASHSISSHTGMAGDFATQYFNDARLLTKLGLVATASAIAIPTDGDNNNTLAAHVIDPLVHRVESAIIMRVGPNGSGCPYGTIFDAIAALPATTATSPALILLEPGVYDETVSFGQSYVHIVGYSREACVITNVGEFPVEADVSDVSISNVTIKCTDTANPSVALRIGDAGVTVRNCVIDSSGASAILISSGATGCAIYDSVIRAKFNAIDADESFEAHCCKVTAAGSGAAGAVVKLTGGAADVRFSACAFESMTTEQNLFSLVDCQATLRGCAYIGLTYLYGYGAGNTNSTVVVLDSEAPSGGEGTVVGAVTETRPVLTGSGAGLSSGSVPNSALATIDTPGLIDDAALSANVALLDADCAFSGVPTLGGMKRAVRTISTNYTVTVDDYLVLIDFGPGTIDTVTLPDPSTCVGQEFLLKVISEGPNSNIAVEYDEDLGYLEGLTQSFTGTLQTFECVGLMSLGTDYFTTVYR